MEKPHEPGNSRSGELSGVLSDFLMNWSNDDNDQWAVNMGGTLSSQTLRFSSPSSYFSQLCNNLFSLYHIYIRESRPN